MEDWNAETSCRDGDQGLDRDRGQAIQEVNELNFDLKSSEEFQNATNDDNREDYTNLQASLSRPPSNTDRRTVSYEGHQLERSMSSSGMGCKVIVSGQQMQSVVVQFTTPHPPEGNSSNGIRSARSYRESIDHVTDRLLPLAQEVSTQELPDISTNQSIDLGKTRGLEDTAPILDLIATMNPDTNPDNILQHLIKRNEEHVRENETLRIQLEQQNAKLEECTARLEELEANNKKLDSEKSVLEQQALSDWRMRVKEEEYAREQIHSNIKEIHRLNEELARHLNPDLNTESHFDIQPDNTRRDDEMEELQQRLSEAEQVIGTLRIDKDSLEKKLARYTSHFKMRSQDFVHIGTVDLRSGNSNPMETLDRRLSRIRETGRRLNATMPPVHFLAPDHFGNLSPKTQATRRGGGSDPSVVILPPITIE